VFSFQNAYGVLSTICMIFVVLGSACVSIFYFAEMTHI